MSGEVRLTVIALACAFVAGAQAPPPQTSRVDRTREFLGLGKAPDPVAAEKGSKVYAQSCAFCHGAKATGAEGPSLVRSTIVLHDDEGEKIGPFLAQGRPDRGMPAFGSLTTDQVKEIAAFLHQRVELAANRGTYKLLNVVTGNAEAGSAYFSGAGGCTKCHSSSGDLAHVGSKYQPADLQAAFLYPDSVVRSEGANGAAPKQRATVKLPSGEVVQGTLRKMDDFDVALTDARGEYRSWPREPGLSVEVEDRLAAHRALLDKYTDADMHNLLSYLVTLK